MKRIISFILVCMMILGVLTLSSCVPIKKIDGEADNTTTQGTTATTAPQEPVPVDSVGGKNAKQLIEKFFNDYKNSKSFDIEAQHVTAEDGMTTTESIALKLTDNDLYMDMKMDEMKMEVWFVDGVLYVDMDGQKYKSSNDDIDDVFGDGFIDEIVSGIPTEYPEAYMKKLEAAQIYSYGGIYYFSVTITAEEAEQMELGEEGYTETVYLKADGTVIKIVDKSATATMTMTVNSYGKNVTITPPADPNSFVDQTTQTSEAYTAYESVCDTLYEAIAYGFDIIVEENSVVSMSYTTDGNGKYVCVLEETNTYEMWIVSGKGYVSVDGERPTQTSVTADMRSTFEELEGMKDYFATPIEEGDMKDLEVIDDYMGVTRITFEVEYFEGTSDFYIIDYSTVNNRIYSVTIMISSMEDGVVTSETTCYFVRLDDDVKIYAPV